MKTLYLDCAMGAAGDMLSAALLELLPNQDDFIREMNALGIPHVLVKKEAATKCGIQGTRMTVTVGGVEEADSLHGHEHTHHHSGMDEIAQIVEHLNLSAKVKSDVLAVYSLLAEAESHAHGVRVTDIHFHEVGTMDAIADITAVCLLMNRLAPQQVIVSPVHVGSGHIQCAHGILPVPAPATADLLRDVPIYGGKIKGELCTPTGAALLKYFATAFGDLPVMKLAAIGYGMGKKNFEAVNCVRALIGDTADEQEKIYELNCNVDDMTAEEIGYAMERLFEAGALEVFSVPVGMKKSRPGTLIRFLCREQDKTGVVRAAFKHTTTIGIRETACNRYVLARNVTTLQTPYGEVRRKDATGYGVSRSKYEYDDLSRIAKEQGVSIAEAKGLIEG